MDKRRVLEKSKDKDFKKTNKKEKQKPESRYPQLGLMRAIQYPIPAFIALPMVICVSSTV